MVEEPKADAATSGSHAVPALAAPGSGKRMEVDGDSLLSAHTTPSSSIPHIPGGSQLRPASGGAVGGAVADAGQARQPSSPARPPQQGGGGSAAGGNGMDLVYC